MDGIATFTILLAGHVIADFLLQSSWMLKYKGRLVVLAGHIAIVAVTAALLMGGTPPIVLGILAITHFGADLVKVRYTKDSLGAFIADQTFHLAVIAGLAWYYPHTFHDWWWAHLASNDQLKCYLWTLVLLTGVIVNLRTGEIVVRKVTARFTAQLRTNIRGLEQGGAYIGFLERGMVMLFMLIQQPAGVGFLITAKSILRFGDVRNSVQRRSTEYIIIGTFLSFAWALLMSVLTQYAMTYWLSHNAR